MLLDLPDATAVSLSAQQSRLTAPDDDARAAPISVATATALTVIVSFSDGTTRDMTADSRVSYVSQSACGVADDASNMLLAVNGSQALGCSSLAVTANVAIGGKVLSASVTLPLVFLDRVALAFTAYLNSAVTVSTVYQIECQTGKYQHATPRVTAHLTDGASSFDVTLESSYSTSDAAVVALSTTPASRLLALSAGSAVVTARFGASPASTSSTLTVSSETAAVSALTWDVYSSAVTR